MNLQMFHKLSLGFTYILMMDEILKELRLKRGLTETALQFIIVTQLRFFNISLVSSTLVYYLFAVTMSPAEVPPTPVRQSCRHRGRLVGG